MLIRRPPLYRTANGSASPRNGSQYLSCAQVPELSVTAHYMILLELSERPHCTQDWKGVPLEMPRSRGLSHDEEVCIGGAFQPSGFGLQ